MDDTRISALAVLGETFTVMFREKKLFFFLTSFLSITTLVFFWPVLDLYVEFLPADVMPEAIDDETSEKILGQISYLAFWFWPYLFITYGVLVAWSRATIGGTITAFDGSIPAIVIRTAKAFWRLFCGMGWVLAVALGTYIIILFLLALVAIAGLVTIDPNATGEVPPLVMALLLPMFVTLFIAVGLITLLISISIHAESRGVSMPIHRCFRLLKGDRIRSGGVLFLVGLIYEIFYTVISLTAVGLFIDTPLWIFIPGFFVMFFFGLAIQLAWITYGAVYANILVPEFDS